MPKIVNHWGVTVNTDIPITGVINSNAIDWSMIDNEICLDCEAYTNEHYKHTKKDSYSANCPNCKQSDSYCLDWSECDSSHTKLIGDWVFNTKDHKYSPDLSGEYSAIVNEITIQVIHSKTIKLCSLCSPCYPGQGDIDSIGEFKTYTLPAYLTQYD